MGYKGSNILITNNKPMSKIWELTKNDFVRGLIVAVMTAPLTLIFQSLQAQAEIDLKQVGIVALTAFCGYILKNLGTSEDGKFLGKI
jgi:hypothetical protein